MPVFTSHIALSTHGNADVHEITGEISRAVAQTGLKNGVVTVFCPSSTSAVTTIEYEPGVVNDLCRLFEALIPSNIPYQHDEAWQDGNGHSHVRAAFLGPSLTVPFVSQRLTLGTWQQVIYIDFDNRPRRRELVLQIIGE